MYVKNLRELIMYILDVFKEKRFWFSVKYILWVFFDKIRGLDYVKNEGYDKLQTNSEQSAVFQATRDTKYLKKILDDLCITSEDCILDLGCGKGYLLKVFSKYQFKKVGGVEISKKLCGIAKRNLTKERIKNFKIYNANAMNFDKYDGYNYIYMFNPFPSAVMKAVIENLNKANVDNKKITIIYHNPVHHMDIVEKGYFKLCAKYKGKSTDYYIYCNK